MIAPLAGPRGPLGVRAVLTARFFLNLSGSFPSLIRILQSQPLSFNPLSTFGMNAFAEPSSAPLNRPDRACDERRVRSSFH